MNRSRLQIAKPDILAFFATTAPKVMKLRELMALLSKERAGWRLAANTSVDSFIQFLEKYGALHQHHFPFPGRSETLFFWGEVPTLELLLHLKAGSYYSHYTALRLHGLTEQVPKTVYLTFERTATRTPAPPPSPASTLTQAAVDQAFRSSPRVSNEVAEFRDLRVVLLNGAYTSQLGVLNDDIQLDGDQLVSVRVTDLERTLIDATVRPAYAGGVFEVAKAFTLARDRLSVNALGAMLTKLRFSYPWHQAIGFYLERAGYPASSLDLLRRFPMELDFYLTHGMVETDYIRDWRVHVPKGF